MNFSKDDIAEAEAYSRSAVAGLGENLAHPLASILATAYLDGQEAGKRKMRSALGDFLAGNVVTQDSASQDSESTTAPGPASMSSDGGQPSVRSLPRASAGASARSVAYEAVRRAHPNPVPSKVLLRILRDWDGVPPSTKRDDLFYKSMKRLRDTGQLTFDETIGYTLPPDVEP